MPEDPSQNDTAMASRSGALEEGLRVFRQYVLKRFLGRGPLGAAWLVLHEGIGREMAMRFIPEAWTRNQSAMTALQGQVRKLLEITHPNIVSVQDFASDGNMAAIITKYVEAEAVHEVKSRAVDRCFTMQNVLPWLAQLCEALDFAWRQHQAIHGDINPQNLLTTRQGDLRVSDLGLARSLFDVRDSEGQPLLTGTLAYISPERASGAPVTAADDVYAFGATVYDMLTSRPPFFRGNVLFQLQSVVPPSMTERRMEFSIMSDQIPADWEEVIAACLAKKPEDRPGSIREVGERLGLLLPGAGEAPLPTVLPRPEAQRTVFRMPIRSLAKEREATPIFPSEMQTMPMEPATMAGANSSTVAASLVETGATQPVIPPAPAEEPDIEPVTMVGVPVTTAPDAAPVSEGTQPIVPPDSSFAPEPALPSAPEIPPEEWEATLPDIPARAPATVIPDSGDEEDIEPVTMVGVPLPVIRAQATTPEPSEPQPQSAPISPKPEPVPPPEEDIEPVTMVGVPLPPASLPKEEHEIPVEELEATMEQTPATVDDIEPLTMVGIPFSEASAEPPLAPVVQPPSASEPVSVTIESAQPQPPAEANAEIPLEKVTAPVEQTKSESPSPVPAEPATEEPKPAAPPPPEKPASSGRSPASEIAAAVREARSAPPIEESAPTLAMEDASLLVPAPEEASPHERSPRSAIRSEVAAAAREARSLPPVEEAAPTLAMEEIRPPSTPPPPPIAKPPQREPSPEELEATVEQILPPPRPAVAPPPEPAPKAASTPAAPPVPPPLPKTEQPPTADADMTPDELEATMPHRPVAKPAGPPPLPKPAPAPTPAKAPVSGASDTEVPRQKLEESVTRIVPEQPAIPAPPKDPPTAVLPPPPPAAAAVAATTITPVAPRSVLPWIAVGAVVLALVAGTAIWLVVRKGNKVATHPHPAQHTPAPIASTPTPAPVPVATPKATTPPPTPVPVPVLAVRSVQASGLSALAGRGRLAEPIVLVGQFKVSSAIPPASPEKQVEVIARPVEPALNAKIRIVFYLRPRSVPPAEGSVMTLDPNSRYLVREVEARDGDSLNAIVTGP